MNEKPGNVGYRKMSQNNAFYNQLLSIEYATPYLTQALLFVKLMNDIILQIEGVFMFLSIRLQKRNFHQ